MSRSIRDLAKKVDTAAMLAEPVYVWRERLAAECQVYVLEENFVAKRFDQVCYKFCNKAEAKDILIDNLYALLRYEYFVEPSEEADSKIQQIIQNFTANLKTTLKKVTLDAGQGNTVKLLPDGCVAFNNGVYDFRNDRWLFKYDIYDIKSIYNRIYMYDPTYLIFWYLRIDFEPLGIKLYNTSFEELLEVCQDLTKAQRNYCFELIYNMSHDQDDKFSKDKFNHLCEIAAYVMLQSFEQSFVFFIGSGGNGKNSLFDGCFSSHLSPMPTSNSLSEIEDNQFITGTLHNRPHNFFFEADPKVYDKSQNLKQLTGSPYQSINEKGVQKYSSFLNCKFVFSANDQDNVKFSDTTDGFRRRINMIEIYYHWDAQKRFLQRGDYYDTTFSSSLDEIKNDVSNSIMFVYLGMYGMMLATKNFTRQFKFDYNDWNISYSDIDIDLKTKLEKIVPTDFIKLAKTSGQLYDEVKHSLYSKDKKPLYDSKAARDYGCKNFDDLLKLFADQEQCISFFIENDVYVSLRVLQMLTKDVTKAATFTQAVKKIYNVKGLQPLYANKPYVLASFRRNHLKILS